MSSAQDLDRFVHDALAQGRSRDDVGRILGEAGWAPEQIRAALSGYAEVSFPVPVPRPRPYLSAREAFLYLVLFTALFVSAYHLGDLLFELINRAWPDPALAYDNGRPAAIRWSMASIIIAFPVYLLLSWKIARELKRQPGNRQSAVRRWLTYLTLFVAVVVLIIDMIVLVNGVLGGELTTRFMLKVLVAAVIAVVVLGYYLWDLRRDETSS